MSHRNVRMDSTCATFNGADNMQSDIQTHLDNSGYGMEDYNVNDGTKREMDENDEFVEVPTLGVNVDFTSSSDANTFHNWLTNYVQDHSGSFQSCRVRVHDCMHGSDENKECRIGDVWNL